MMTGPNLISLPVAPLAWASARRENTKTPAAIATTTNSSAARLALPDNELFDLNDIFPSFRALARHSNTTRRSHLSHSRNGWASSRFHVLRQHITGLRCLDVYGIG